MAEAIGVAGGLVGLAAFAGQCSVALWETITSYQSHNQRVRDLVDETSALADVLHSLAETARANHELQIPALAIPLKQCGKACREFEQEIKKFSSRSDGKRTSFRDWARLRYMGEDVDGFRRLLSGYKMTITVALTDASLYVMPPTWLVNPFFAQDHFLTFGFVPQTAANLSSPPKPSRATMSFS